MSTRIQETITKLSHIITQDPGIPVSNPTKSYWQDPPIQLSSSPPAKEADVVIIGSGITGCSVAYHLLRANSDVRVVMLEARKATSGATGRNGGHLKATPELSYASLLPRVGKKQAREVVDFTLKNVRDVLALSETLQDDLKAASEVRKVEALNVFIEKDGFDEMKSVLRQFDDDNPDLAGRLCPISRDKLLSKHGIANAAGAFTSQAGALWPYRLITDLLSSLSTTHPTRFQIHEDTPVRSLSFFPSSNRYHLTTPSTIFTAAKVIHATNGHATHLLPSLRGTLFPIRGQMTVQTATSTFGVQGGDKSWSIHYPQGFDYITQSGVTGEIFAGGGIGFSSALSELGSVRDDENAVLPVAHLSGIMDAVWGCRVREGGKGAWTGVMGFTADGLPLVGILGEEVTRRGGGGEWIAAGYNGYGMANAWLCGKYIGEKVGGSEVVEKVPEAYFVTRERIEAARDTMATAKKIMKLRGGMQ